MARSVLDKAQLLFFNKKHSAVIKLLEPHILEYRDSFLFHLYLGLSYLNLGNIGSAVDYFSAARTLNAANPDLLTAQAALSLRRGDTNRAIEYYLQALDYDENCLLAKKGLNFIRHNNTPEAIGDIVQSGKIKQFYPVPGKKQYTMRLAVIALSTAVIAILFIGGFFFLPTMLQKITPQRADMSQLTLEKAEKQNPVEASAAVTHYILTEKEVLAAYQQAHTYFQNFHDNLAQIEVNRILYSNAAHSIKQKARLLMDYFATPGFDSIQDAFLYEEVKADPFLYTDCWVVWTGMAANIQVGTHASSFDLLVGYDKQERLEGIVPVFCGFIADIDSERSLSVLGTVQLRNDAIYLTAKSIFQSKLPQQTRGD